MFQNKKWPARFFVLAHHVPPCFARESVSSPSSVGLGCQARGHPHASSPSHKVVGHLLTEAGYTLWYWGYKNPYMAEYEARNAAGMLPGAAEFYDD